MTAIHPSSFISLWSGIVALFAGTPCTTRGVRRESDDLESGGLNKEV